MAVTFNKPKGMKYTDMAIYIDNHLPEIKVPNQHPEVEAKIYEYIYHILYALACKSGYFKHFSDYDAFACYGACELFLSMRKKLINEGKEVRGKVVVPIKSSLNFIKATMFPLKVTYQREAFRHVEDPLLDDDIEEFHLNSRAEIQRSYRRDLAEDLQSMLADFPKILSKILSETPFQFDKLMRKKLQISIMLTILDDITLPNRLKNKLESKMVDDSDKIMNKLILAYEENPDNVILWHLDSGYATYVRFLTQRVKRQMGKELKVTIHEDDLSDDIIDSIMNSAFDEYQNESNKDGV